MELKVVVATAVGGVFVVTAADSSEIEEDRGEKDVTGSMIVEYHEVATAETTAMISNCRFFIFMVC